MSLTTPKSTPRPPTGLDRRDFLTAAGFTFGSALAGCSGAPVERAIPYLVQPDEITPGKAYHYASTCAACPAACGLLVKCRDGRPIKLEGNPAHPLSQGGLCGPGQASILGLYDSRRFAGPLRNGQEVTWEELDAEVLARLEEVRAGGGKVRVLTRTIHSPTTRRALAGFLEGFDDARHVVYDPGPSSAIRRAHQQTHGASVVPRYRFDSADLIVSFDADFLGTWLSPVEHTAAYRAGRELDSLPPKLSHHVQFESRLSLSGTKADERTTVAPDEIGSVMTRLAGLLAAKAGVEFDSGATSTPAVDADRLDDLVERLWSARGRTLVVCGARDSNTQLLANYLNHLLDAYGATLDLAGGSPQRGGADPELKLLMDEIAGGEVDALLVADVDVVQELPEGEGLGAQLAGVGLFVYAAERPDDTSTHADYVCAEPHFLAAWGDAEPVQGLFTLQQPVIRPITNTRPFIESLAAWNHAGMSAYDQVRLAWRETVFPRQAGEAQFEPFWEGALERGVVDTAVAEGASAHPIDVEGVRAIAGGPSPTGGELALVLYPKVGMPDASHAYNAWLQEVPDPVSKVTWDNYVSLSRATAAGLSVSDGDVVRLTTADDVASIEAPALVQSGQHDGVAALALGYGAKASERFAELGPQWLEARPSVGPNGRVGVNAASLIEWKDAELQVSGRRIRVEPTGERRPLAATQMHHSLDVPEHLAPRGARRRPIVLESDWETHQQQVANRETSHIEPHPSLWPDEHASEGAQWGMMIDLNACTGCSACVVSCQAENNIPVVGKDEVRRQREMHWMRIDRYYWGDGDDFRTAYQPMLCQHCANAPCETVCPVLATVHSEEGLNQQVYNRCVGTRYCANNCPYKVRRFNWFDYAHDDDVENLVYNPDVTVRSRGVMEKCSFCVQRIQEAKVEARSGGETLSDGDVQTACQQSCPAKAITFGDLNDPCSRASELAESPRRYRVLEEMNFDTAVSYLKIVRRDVATQEEETHG